MNDYINRQAAIDAICKHGTELERRGITVLAVVNHKQVTVDLLENLPSADVEPVKHGRWINDGGLYKCSVCNTFPITGWANCIPIDQMNKTMRYCPNCGARMDLEGEDHEQN